MYKTMALILWLFGLLGWAMFLKERARSRDYVTDLLQLVYDHDLGRDDLRRSLGHDEVDDHLERWSE